MTSRTAAMMIAAILLVTWQSARAGSACAVGFNPETSGFALNPTLDKLTVSSAKPKTAKDTCVLQTGDEVLQVNQQLIPGARALAVRKYWNSLKSDAPITFRVKRAGAVLTLTSK